MWWPPTETFETVSYTHLWAGGRRCGRQIVRRVAKAVGHLGSNFGRAGFAPFRRAHQPFGFGGRALVGTVNVGPLIFFFGHHP